jgi:hypothetical protein
VIRQGPCDAPEKPGQAEILVTYQISESIDSIKPALEGPGPNAQTLVR